MTEENNPAPSERSRSIPKIFLGFFVLFLVLRLFSGAGLLSHPKLKFSEGKEKTLQDLQTLDGTPVSLDDFRGDVVVLSFWATWCPPCVRELPSLVSLREKTAGEGIEVLCVSREDPEKVRKFVEKKGYPPEMFLISQKDSKKWIGGSIPVTYILDPSGRVRDSHRGAATWDSDSVVRQLKSLHG